jgi:LysR family glycine cleavage system transcriptional activator
VVSERFARTPCRAGRVGLSLAQSFPMRQAHYLLRPSAPPLPIDARADLRRLARPPRPGAPSSSYRPLPRC